MITLASHNHYKEQPVPPTLMVCVYLCELKDGTFKPIIGKRKSHYPYLYPKPRSAILLAPG